MSGSIYFRRFAPVVALALIALTRPVWGQGDAGACEPFQATGTTEFVSEDDQGNFVLATEGTARPGGRFTGSVVGRNTAPGNVQVAVVTLDFGGGDTLTFDTRIKLDKATGTYVGTYEITGGTGAFAGASGGGDLVADTTAGTFTLSGEICQ